MKKQYFFTFIFALISVLVVYPNNICAIIIQADQPLAFEIAEATPDTNQPNGSSTGSTYNQNPVATSPQGTKSVNKQAGTANQNAAPGNSTGANPAAAGTAGSNPAVNISECTKSLGLIFDDVQKKNDPNNRSYTPAVQWNDLAWLEKALGSPALSTTVGQSIVHWTNFNIVVRNGRVIRALGQYPGKKAPMLDTYPVYMGRVTREIGPPLNVIQENLTQFVWNCNDSSSTLSVLADDQGVVIQIFGTYCNRTIGCKSFGSLGDESTALTKLMQ